MTRQGASPMSSSRVPRHRIAPSALRLGILAIALGATGCTTPADSTPPREAVDVLITGGLVFDGHDTPGRAADVALSADRIVAVGDDLAGRYQATRTVDASGKIVAPGFIDPHTHPERYIRSADKDERRNLPWLHQGVSTVFIGIDGGGSPKVADDRAWFEANGVGTNIAAYVGFGPVRRAVLGEDARAPDESELARMRGLVAQAMCEGAFGLSTGLFYTPQSYASTDEVVALATEAARRGGIYDTHQRDESSYSMGLLGSVEEVLEIGRRAGMPVHIAHIKALGSDVHGKAADVIARIERAQVEGQKVTADQYPWLASGTALGAALLPGWAVDGGRAALLDRLDDAATAARIRAGMQANLVRRGGAEALLLTGRGWPWTGKTLAAVAREWTLDPVDAALRIITSESDRDAHRVASFNMDRRDVDTFMRQPWVLTASDGTDGHPRQYATYPEKYAQFVVRDQVISLQDYIHRATGLVATTMQLRERGFLEPGHYADVVVFDPEQFAPRATYTEPAQLSAGVDYLFVNGTAMIDQGQPAHAWAGRVLQHQPPAGTCP